MPCQRFDKQREKRKSGEQNQAAELVACQVSGWRRALEFAPSFSVDGLLHGTLWCRRRLGYVRRCMTIAKSGPAEASFGLNEN
jgi:hypothetical protein